MTDKLSLINTAKTLTGETNIDALIEAAGKLERYLNPLHSTTRSHPFLSHIQPNIGEFACTVGILHPTRGTIPFHLYDYQRKALQDIANFGQGNIAIASSRQLGWTYMLSVYALHQAVSKPGTTHLVVGTKLTIALQIFERIKVMLSSRPDIKVTTCNRNEIVFANGSKIIARATNLDSPRGLSVDSVIVEDAAHISHKTFNELLASLQPMVSTGGKLIVQSTPRISNDPFHEFYKNAEFRIHQDWRVHPDRDEAWASAIRDQLGPVKFAVAYDALFIKEQ